MRAFDNAFKSYMQAARSARAEDKAEKQRQQLFLSFIQQGFGIEAREIELERQVALTQIERRGYIDVLFGDVVIEFKRELAEATRAKDEAQLCDYLIAQRAQGEHVGLLTDGLVFWAYSLDETTLRQIGAFELRDDDPEAAYQQLDAYLFSQKQAVPTASDIVLRFGVDSPTFQAAAKTLRDLLARLADAPALALKRNLWRGLLAKVYGSDITSDDLFVRHTYLNQFAKLLAYAALKGTPQDDQALAAVIRGDAFHEFGVSNLGEIDLFAWILEGEVQSEALRMLRRLAASLIVYDLSKIDQDLLKQLYQNLVDPETRHLLGEFYTPDWMAELTLREIGYQPGQSLLDPACGSGTFLFTAIRYLAQQGLTGWPLVDFALENIVGMDVHPLAVTIARTNYLLAVQPHMGGPRSSGRMGLVPLPVYMADTLQTPEESGLHKDTLILPADAESNENFYVPRSAAQEPSAYTEVIEQMEAYAQYAGDEIGNNLTQKFGAVVQERFGPAKRGTHDLSISYWSQNLRLLKKLIEEERNSIWAYMLKNAARPLLLAEQKFDVVAGNPPWLTYKDIQDKTYQAEVRDLILNKYRLLESSDRQLSTQMELATLFMVHCEAVYLKSGGTIGFVMPRSTITGARQHRRFQAQGVTRILDFLEVKPRPFNIESVVLIRSGRERPTDAVPTTRYGGRLPKKEIRLAEAEPHLAQAEGVSRFIGAAAAQSPYHGEFKAGASLYPRNLCFVKPRQALQPGDAAVNPAMESDPDVDGEAKGDWKGVRLTGLVYESNLYATLLSKNLVPFGIRRLHLVALPVRLVDRKLMPMSEQDFLLAGHIDSWRTWFGPAEQKWAEIRKETSGFATLIDQYDFQRLLVSQQPQGSHKVLYNSSGVHLASCVIDAKALKVMSVDSCKR